MRNLKRALSMALAAVMLLGMMVIGASAAGYNELTDTDEIVNKEAVALLVDLGVIDGKSSGRYDPAGTLQRVEFTKLVFGMMMGQNSDATVYEGAGIFSDVAGCWGEGYINYCASLGIVGGVGKDANGKDRFSPYSSLTVAATAKMLLVALGYHDDDRGYNGDAWTVAVMRDAQSMGLLDGVTGQGANDAITRDNAAQMIFNALFATTKSAVMLPGGNVGSETVAYYMDGPTLAESRYNGLYAVEGILTTYGNATQTTVDDISVAAESDAADVATPVVYYRDRDGLVSTVVVPTEDAVVLGTNYDGNVALDGANGTTVKDDLSTRSSKSFIARADSEVTYVYNNFIETKATIVSNRAAHGRGVVTELIDIDGNGRYDVVRVTDQTVSFSSGLKSTTNANGVTKVTDTGITGLNNVDPETVFGAEGINAGDCVLWFKDKNGNFFLQKAESFDGVMTSTSANNGQDATDKPSTYTIGGVPYEAAGINGAVKIGGNSSAKALKDFAGLSGVTYYLSNGGYIAAARSSVAKPTDLLIVLKNNKFDPESVFEGSTQQSQVVFVNETGDTGIIDIATIDKNDGKGAQDVAAGTNVPQTVDDWSVSNNNYTKPNSVNLGGQGQNNARPDMYYYTQENGLYALTEAPTQMVDNTTIFKNGVPTAFKTTYQAATGVASSIVTTDSKTVFLVRDAETTNAAGTPTKYKDTYTVYVGYTNVPTIEKPNAVAYVNGNHVAEYVVINGYDKLTDTVAEQYFYTMDYEVTAHYNAAGKIDHYTVPAILNGVETTVTLAPNAQIWDSTANAYVAVNANTSVNAYELYIIEGYNAAGQVSKLGDATDTAKQTSIGTGFWTDLGSIGIPSNDVVMIGSYAFNCTNGATVYVVDEDQTVLQIGDLSLVNAYAYSGRVANVEVVTEGGTYGNAGNVTVKEIYIYATETPATPEDPSGGASSYVDSIIFRDAVASNTVAVDVTFKTVPVSGGHFEVTAQLQQSLDNGQTWTNVGVAATKTGAANASTVDPVTLPAAPGTTLYRAVVTVEMVNGTTTTILVSNHITNNAFCL